MKIYRLLECSGEYEDYMELHRGTYLSKERAMKEKKKAEQLEKEAQEQSELCAACQFEDNCGKMCIHYKSSKGHPNECANYMMHWTYSIYRIEEEEVIE